MRMKLMWISGHYIAILNPYFAKPGYTIFKPNVDPDQLASEMTAVSLIRINMVS